nr:MAG TPA: hypothetical protein [Caudoviricetes sp.]
MPFSCNRSTKTIDSICLIDTTNRLKSHQQ